MEDKSEAGSSHKRCVVYRCPNTSRGFTVHGFPHKKPELLAKWVSFVRQNRPNWAPTKHSVICSVHFTDDSYPLRYKLEAKLTGRMVRRKMLNETAFPCINLTTHEEFTSDLSTSVSKKRKLSSPTPEVIFITYRSITKHTKKLKLAKYQHLLFV